MITDHARTTATTHGAMTGARNYEVASELASLLVALAEVSLRRFARLQLE